MPDSEPTVTVTMPLRSWVGLGCVKAILDQLVDYYGETVDGSHIPVGTAKLELAEAIESAKIETPRE